MKVEAPRELGAAISASGTHAQSAALDGRDIVVSADVAFYILFGSNPTATTSAMRIPANTAVPFTNIIPGEKFSVILASGTGTVNWAPLG